MLHFLTYKLDVVYIGVYDWGEDECMQEVKPSFYVFVWE